MADAPARRTVTSFESGLRSLSPLRPRYSNLFFVFERSILGWSEK